MFRSNPESGGVQQSGRVTFPAHPLSRSHLLCTTAPLHVLLDADADAPSLPAGRPAPYSSALAAIGAYRGTRIGQALVAPRYATRNLADLPDTN